MSQLIRLLRQWPVLLHHFISSVLYHNFLNSLLHPEPRKSISFPPNPVASAHRDVHFRSQGLRLTNVPHPSELQKGSDSDSDMEVKKSRNQLKQEARRAVRWVMDLASFSPPQIKRILRAVSLEREVFEGVMLVKRLGPDVPEGKRRQFNYVGKLQEVQPELMDKLIKATKDADHKELQALCCLDSQAVEDDNDTIETESDEDEEELRKLVRRVLSGQEQEATNEEEKKIGAAMMGSKRVLTVRTSGEHGGPKDELRPTVESPKAWRVYVRKGTRAKGEKLARSGGARMELVQIGHS